MPTLTPNDKALFEHLDQLASVMPGFFYQLMRRPDGNWEYLYVSENCKTLFGVERKRVYADANTLLDRIHPEDFDRVVAESMACAEKMKQWQCEFRMVNSQGDLLWIEARDMPQRLDDGSILWTGYANDITARKTLELEVMRLAHHDPLTKLPNRALFFEMVQQAVNVARRERRKVALMFIDLDNFKPVNDAWGHGAGDRLLEELAQRLRDTLRISDTVGRLGGDEFVVLLPEVDAVSDALRAAGKIREQVALPFDIDGRSAKVTASIGIALFPAHGTTVDELERNADAAMYAAKKRGKNCDAVFSPDMAS